jgi:hypothetical protein
LLLAEDSDDSPTEENEHQKQVEANGPVAVEGLGSIGDEKPQYYITISRRNGFRRLHLSGACPVQAWKCQEMEEVADIRSAAFDVVCLNCKRKIQLQEGLEEPPEESDSVGDSSSTDSDVPAMEGQD